MYFTDKLKYIEDKPIQNVNNINTLSYHEKKIIDNETNVRMDQKHKKW